MDTAEYFIDVREEAEYNMGHVEGSINVPAESLMAGAPQMASVPKDAAIVVYRRSGSRSELAIKLFREMGFTNLTNGINKEMVKLKYTSFK
jgi:rhodanese-related sulfurtransferase